MTASFPVDSRLDTLRAVRAGRVALDGFEYQRAFAVLRLVSLVMRRSVPGATEVPAWLRYEWAEDLDEVATDGTVILWQCKRGDHWHQPAKLVDVLEGFASKWLWTPGAERSRLRFRLVTSDPVFAGAHDLPVQFGADGRTDAREAFLERLAEPPADRTDRARWQADAADYGHDDLFDALWASASVLYMPGDAKPHGGVTVRRAEEMAVHELDKGRRIRDLGQLGSVVASLQALLTTTPPGAADAAGTLVRPEVAPKVILPGDVEHRLFDHAPAKAGRPPFALIDHTSLELRRADKRPDPYVARRPEWSEVVRGRDVEVRFLERAITNEVEGRVGAAIKAADKGEGWLRIIFLTGAPGAGKSTLALRVAAKLIDAGACVVADARFPVAKDEEIDGLVDGVLHAASGGRPVLLLLDDPLGGNSGWPRVLKQIGRSNPRVVAFAATPEFLFERHRGKLDGVELQAPIVVDRPTFEERQDLASLYPEADATSIAASEEDLLVLSMEAAAGTPFDNIIAGIWRTLANQQTLPDDVLGDDLSWQVAALVLVTFFHRAYVPCPEPLVRAVLSGRKDVGDYAAERLRDLKLKQGWRIFRIESPGRWAYQGDSLFAMHARVAQRAWELRPAPAWNVASVIAEASARVPQVARPLGQSIAALHERDAANAADLLKETITAWTVGSAAETIQTRQLDELATALSIGGLKPQPLFADLHRRAAVCDGQSWLALRHLYYLSASTAQARHFPDELPVGQILECADFSVAPVRTAKLANVLAGRPEDLARFEARLWSAFDGQLPWMVDPRLLEWLLTKGASSSVRQRVSGIRGWLAAHPDDSHVRTLFLALLARSPDLALPDDVRSALAWARHHPIEQNVRTQLIGLFRSSGSSELAPFLAEALELITAGRRGYSVGGAALIAASTLGPSSAGLTARWLVWGADLVGNSEGKRIVQSVANAMTAPYIALRALLLAGKIDGADRPTVEAALEATRDACTRWYLSVGDPLPPAFRT